MSEEYHPAQKVAVSAEQAGQRLDNFLFARFRRLPKTRIYKMLRKGEVRVNGGRAKQSYRIQAGDEVRLPPVRLPAITGGPAILGRDIQAVSDAVLFENQDLLVLNKPSGLAVHSGSGVDYGAIDVLRKLRPQAPFLELAHRLDRSTSGCLLIALNRKTLVAIHEQWKSGAVSKQYLALIAGRWRGGEQRVDLSLQRVGAKGKVRHTDVNDEGKRAVSHFKPIEIHEKASLMQVTIDTGRTHQIRVHAAELGHPLLGDDRYGDFRLNREWRKRGLKRLFLHAQLLQFRLPRQEEFLFEAPLPRELQHVLEQIQ